MIDLIKEIEKLKLSNSFIIGEYSFGFTDGKNQTIKEVLELLNQYNIITAPKEIKLSEIVDRLKNDCGYGDVEIKRYSTYTDVWGIEYNLYLSSDSLFDFNLEGKITIHNDCIYNWLYTLWIAGTKIIDDLEKN